MSVKALWSGGALFLALLSPGWFLYAKTIEVEIGAEDNASPSASSGSLTLAPTGASGAAVESQAPTQVPKTTPASPETVIQSPELLSPGETNENSAKNKRTRASQGLSFYSFLAAGFVVSDSEPGDVLGKVIAASGDPLNYSQPSEAHARLVKPSRSKIGDLWTVYHLYENSLEDSDVNFQGSWGETRAVVQVEEIIKNVAKVKIIEGFEPFGEGDLVRDYGIDVKRWKRAQTKKNLPPAEIRCYVAGGAALNMNFNQWDNIVLTAGARKGVGEGMVFEMDQKTEQRGGGEAVFVSAGAAEVFYCGNTYSLARVTQSTEVIRKGFTAIYRP
jgi:hypothetical protein